MMILSGDEEEDTYFEDVWQGYTTDPYITIGTKILKSPLYGDFR